MRARAWWFASLVVLALTPLCAEAAGTRVELRSHTLREWNIELPHRALFPVGTKFAFADGMGRDFAVKPEGTALWVDTDGDGAFDVKAEGKEAIVRLHGTDARGQKLSYSVHLVSGTGWQYEAASVRRGKIGDTKIQFIDQNGNGRFDDVGIDAMAVGRSKHACLLSEAIAIDGTLHSLHVATDGSSCELTPYDGPTGRLDLAECDTKAKVLSAVVQSKDRRFSFDLAKAKSLRVPVGDYELVCGQLGLGLNRVQVRTGRSTTFHVAEEAPRTVAWGGPVRAEFAYRRAGDSVGLSPDKVWYYGKAGEEYYGWLPIGKSPKFTVFAKSGREIAQAYFPGTC